MDQRFAVEAVVIGQGNLGRFFGAFDKDAQGELGRVLGQQFVFQHLSVDAVFLYQTDLVGHHHGRMKIVGRGQAGERIVLVGEGLGESLVGFLEEISGVLSFDFPAQREGVDEHTESVGAAHIVAAVGHGAHKHFLLSAESAHRDEGGAEEVTGGRNAEGVAARDDVGAEFLAQPDFVAHLVFLRLFVRDDAGFLFFAGHQGVEEVFRLLEVGAFLVGLLVFGVVEIAVALFLGGFAFQRRREFGQEYVVGTAVEHQVVEIAHQTQFAGRLDDVEAVKRTRAEVVGLHKGLFEPEEILFALELGIRNVFFQFARDQEYFAVPLLEVAEYGGVRFQDLLEGFLQRFHLRSLGEGEDEGQVVGRGGRIFHAVEIKTGLLEGEFLRLVGGILFRRGFLRLAPLGEDEFEQVVLDALQARRLGETVHVRFQTVAVVEFRGQSKGCDGGQSAEIQGLRQTEAADAHAFLDEGAQFFFEHIERGHVFFDFLGLGFRFGQGLHVDLLVDVEGNGLDLHRDGGHHIRGFLRRDELVQFPDVDFLLADDVGGQELSGAGTRFVEGLYGDVLDAREFPDDRFHFFELDAESADLHLTVFPAHELDFSVFAHADDVTGAVDAAVVRVFVEGIVDEYFGCLVRAVEVAQAYLLAGNPEFAGLSLGNFLVVFDHIGLDAGEGTADGNVLFLYLHFFAHHIADGLRGAVAVEQPVVGQGEGGHFLSAGVHHFESLAIGVVDGKLRSDLGGHKAVGDAIFFKVGVQGREIEPDALGYHIERASADEGTVQVGDKCVEAEGGVGGHAGVRVQADILRVVAAISENVAVREHTAFRRAGRTAGVKQDEQIVGRRLSLGLAGMQFPDV